MNYSVKKMFIVYGTALTIKVKKINIRYERLVQSYDITNKKEIIEEKALKTAWQVGDKAWFIDKFSTGYFEGIILETSYRSGVTLLECTQSGLTVAVPSNQLYTSEFELIQIDENIKDKYRAAIKTEKDLIIFMMKNYVNAKEHTDDNARIVAFEKMAEFGIERSSDMHL